MKRLILFTSVFPYPAKSMETYLETECRYYGQFDEVIMFSLGVGRRTLDRCRRLNADNIKVIPILFAPKIRYILNVYTAFFDKNFYREIQKLVQQKRLNLRRLVRLLIYLSRSHYEAKLVSKALENIDLCRSENVVYVYRFEYHPYVPILLKRELGECPMVARAHRYDLYEERNSDRYIPLREVLLRELDRVCLIAEDGRKYLEKKFPEYAEKLSVQRLGTEDYGLGVGKDRKPFRVVSCSNIVPVKRVNRIVDVLAELDEEVLWTHYGAGEGFDEIQQYAVSTLPSNIRFQFKGQIGNQALMQEYEKEGYNLFINLSESEGVPVSIMEAMSFGIPCIATNVGGTGEIVEEGVNGYLVPENFKDNDVAGKIRCFLTMPDEEYEKICAGARTTWNDKYSAKKNYKEFEVILYGMAKSHGGGISYSLDTPRREKILVVGRSLPEKKTGMIGLFEFEQAQELNKRGIDADYMFCDTRSIIRIQQNDFVDKKIKNMNVVGTHYPIGRLPYTIFSVLKTKRFIQIYENYIEQYGRPTVIHIHFPSILLTEDIWEYLKDTKIPIVVTEHFTKVIRKALNSRERKLLARVVEECEQYICVSEALKNSVVEMTATEKAIRVLPNIVAMENTEKMEYKKIAEVFTYIVVCRLVRVKQVEQVVQALSLLVKKKMDVQLVIVGDGPRRRSIEREIKQNSLDHYVVMKGMLAHDLVMDEMKKADAYVSASILETFGVPFVEAWACGKPVIAADNSPILPYIDSSNGVIFERNNVHDLARAMEQIYRDKNQYDEKKIHDFAKDYFSAEVITDKLIKIYEDVQR